MKEKKGMIIILLLIFLIAIGILVYNINKTSAPINTEYTELELNSDLWERQGTTIVCSQIETLKNSKDIKVKVDLKNNPGLCALTLTLQYDESALKLVSADNGSDFKEILDFSHSKNLVSGVCFNWDSEHIDDNDIIDGTILELTFEVAENIKDGTYQLVFINNCAVDNNLEDVDLNIVNGYIQVNN